MSFYLCIEGTDGAGKSTQCKLSEQYCFANDISCVNTAEPGSPLIPVTMKLKELMLDKRYDNNMIAVKTEINSLIHNHKLNDTAKMFLDKILQFKEDGKMPKIVREYISQASRSIHLEHIKRKIQNKSIELIIQDRGILSGLAYGVACGNDESQLIEFASTIDSDFYNLYNLIIYLKGDPTKNLEATQNRTSEFKDGDVIESKGSSFQETVAQNLEKYIVNFKNYVVINVTGKSREEINKEIIDLILEYW